MQPLCYAVHIWSFQFALSLHLDVSTLWSRCLYVQSPAYYKQPQWSSMFFRCYSGKLRRFNISLRLLWNNSVSALSLQFAGRVTFVLHISIYTSSFHAHKTKTVNVFSSIPFFDIVFWLHCRVVEIVKLNSVIHLRNSTHLARRKSFRRRRLLNFLCREKSMFSDS